ncbi:MAG: hypothetical protein CMM74_03520 [Rhodospirillaceae bacterium]|jgi:hypothetical protein|nr:hypothetical protein [Rhodospirillaceae bacterium]
MTLPVFKDLNVLWELPENWCEWDHIGETLQRVSHHLVNLGTADRFVFIVTSMGDQLPVAHSERTVVIQTSDEGHEIPSYAGDVFMVFKNYRPFDPAPENLRVIPLGCNKDVPDLALRSMPERPVDIFFTGWDNHRESFFTAVDAAYPAGEGQLGGRDLTIDIGRQKDFRSGMKPEDYARRLAETKIALSPRGVSHETFRTYEAMRAGCIVIANRQLPAWYLDGWPVIELDDWQGFGKIVEDILGDEMRLQDLSEQNRTWWQNYCSPEAVAHYVVRELSLKLMQGE